MPATEAPLDAYLCRVAWCDELKSQGALGQFKRKSSEAVYSSDAAWEVCATGSPYDPTPGRPTASGPPLDVVNSDIAVCNAGTGSKQTTSGGWINAAGAVTSGAVGKLAVGQDNSAFATFPVTCQKDQFGNAGIDPQAKWMRCSPTKGDAFTGRETRAYLIFHLPAKELPAPPK